MEMVTGGKDFVRGGLCKFKACTNELENVQDQVVHTASSKTWMHNVWKRSNIYYYFDMQNTYVKRCYNFLDGFVVRL